MLRMTEFPLSMSNIEIDRAQREIVQKESDDSDSTLPPRPSGTFEVDESVIACKKVLGPSTSCWFFLTIASFPHTWGQSCPRAELWHVTLGEGCKDYREFAIWRGERLFSQGLF